MKNRLRADMSRANEKKWENLEDGVHEKFKRLRADIAHLETAADQTADDVGI